MQQKQEAIDIRTAWNMMKETGQFLQARTRAEQDQAEVDSSLKLKAKGSRSFSDML